MIKNLKVHLIKLNHIIIKLIQFNKLKYLLLIWMINHIYTIILIDYHMDIGEYNNYKINDDIINDYIIYII